jgi:pimeloyl-ACP methyl ester carboxylesterase
MTSHPRLRFLLASFALAAVLLAPAMAAADNPPALPAGWSSNYAYANGIRIHYYRPIPAPGRPVIVMVHGVTDNGLSFSGIASRLQANYDIYMLDTRGHGLTDPFTPSDNSDTLIKDVVEFVRVMKFEKPTLLGHSMGGATVIRVGAEYPDLARSIIVIDAGIGGGRGAGPGAGRGNAGRGAGAGAPAAVPSQPANADPMPFNMQGTPEMLVAQNNYPFDALVERGRRQNPKWSLTDVQYNALAKRQYHGAYSGELFREVMQGSMRTGNSLATIPVPMIILKADAAPEARKLHLEAASVMRNGRLVHIDGGGHNLHRDEVSRTAEVLAEFLAKP